MWESIFLIFLIGHLLATNIEPGSDRRTDNLVPEKRRPPMMFINSGFTGGGSKQGHFDRVQKSKSYLSGNGLGMNHLFVVKNPKVIEEEGIPSHHFNLKIFRPGFNNIKEDHLVRVQRLTCLNIIITYFSGKAWAMDSNRLQMPTD